MAHVCVDMSYSLLSMCFSIKFVSQPRNSPPIKILSIQSLFEMPEMISLPMWGTWLHLVGIMANLWELLFWNLPLTKATTDPLEWFMWSGGCHGSPTLLPRGEYMRQGEEIHPSVISRSPSKITASQKEQDNAGHLCVPMFHLTKSKGHCHLCE